MFLDFDESPGGTLTIFEKKLSVVESDLGVLPGHGLLHDDDLVLGVPPDAASLFV